MQHNKSEQESFYRSQSFWLDTVPGRLEPRPALEGEQSADVVIVGGGYTGLWTAYYLKHHAPHLDVAVLEAEIAGFGASGRNGGWCSAYLAGIEHWADNPDTRPAAVALQQDMNAAVDEIGRVSCKEAIDCHFDKSGHLGVAVNPTQLARHRKTVNWYHELGFDNNDITWLDKTAIEQEIGIAGALGGFHMRHCAAIHPARLARGLARAAVAKGVRIYEGSPVIRLGSKALETPRGRMKAGVTLLATEGFTGSIENFQRRLIPVHSMMIATEKLTEAEIESTGLRRRHAWNNGNHLVTYGQLTQDGRIAFGSRGRYRWNSGVETSFSPGDPVFEEVRAELTALFPVLENKPISHAWGGPLGVARTLRPAVCFDRKTCFGWAGGYFGDGVGATNLAGRTLADLVLERDTERSRAVWVNPPGSQSPPSRTWEPEPLRWMAIAARYRIMDWADQAEAANRPAAARWNHVLESVFP